MSLKMALKKEFFESDHIGFLFRLEGDRNESEGHYQVIKEGR